MPVGWKARYWKTRGWPRHNYRWTFPAQCFWFLVVGPLLIYWAAAGSVWISLLLWWAPCWVIGELDRLRYWSNEDMNL